VAAVPAQDSPADSAATAMQYLHAVEIHDVGCYMFKGVAHDFSLKSINLRALSQRNEAYKGGLKTSKAVKTSSGTGFERVSSSYCGQTLLQ
jgi:hypothetical protein